MRLTSKLLALVCTATVLAGTAPASFADDAVRASSPVGIAFLDLNCLHVRVNDAYAFHIQADGPFIIDLRPMVEGVVR